MAEPGLTVSEVASRYRVGPDKVRTWIGCGELKAVNTAASRLARPRWVIPADSLAAFERSRASGPTPAPAPRARRRGPAVIDYYA